VNNSLDRLFAGIVASLRSEIIPRLDDEFARGQAYAAVDLLNNLRPRIDWALKPLAEQITAQLMAANHIGAWVPELALPEALKHAPEFPTGEALRIYRDALDEHLCKVIDWLQQAAPERRDAVQGALDRYMKEQVRREVGLAAKPLFGEIAGNASADKK
jgi:hypothetical protein